MHTIPKYVAWQMRLAKSLLAAVCIGYTVTQYFLIAIATVGKLRADVKVVVSDDNTVFHAAE